ncbi:MAG: peptidoglycan DD-metalloendopeptidase family protein [Alistipes sp.]|jgi:murein DD-endopeptidase MepM/ murein hydrolase activator NlpD|nr:peptidoglycan DD-metalloendopeptidase family protein [Alistipes sp.]MBR5771306.1 peptidoglycan DD-metalloendopeptidase family protein [Alistipes sp.]
MKLIKLYILSALMLVTSTAFAQEADTVKVAADSLRNATKEQPMPVKPVRTLGKVAVIDTLPTANSALSIVLFNDNTWRYILAEDYKNDPEVFNNHWDTTNIHAYRDIELDSLPEATAIRLVDSLESYHYPYIGRITSRYGPRRGRAHQGLDIGLKTGDPIYATFDGKVRLSKAAGDYGNLVIIRHNNGLETYYAHLSQRDVEVGDWVVAGQQIGLGGSTGRSTGPHLHYEVRYKGQSFDPERLIDFSNGNLRRDELLLKRRHFSIYSKYEQDFGDEEEVAKQEEAERKAAAAVQYHTVRSGDTLGAIARKYGTSVSRICQLSGIKSTSILRIGQKLRVR